MARLKLPSTALLVAVVLLATAEPGIASKPEPRTTPTRFPPLVDCGPAPAPVGRPAGGSVGFRANVRSLLRDIPSAAAAAAPAGFVTERSGRTGRDRAFARGLCFGGANTTSSAAGCRACLSAAARDATGRCGRASRRAGVWRAGCFLSYADTDSLSAREEEFRGWFYADPDTAALEDRVCAGDRTGPDCDRCFKDAARALVALPWLVRMRREVIVVGYSCSLRVHSNVLPINVMGTLHSFLNFTLLIMVIAAEMAIVLELLLFIVITLRGEETLLGVSCAGEETVKMSMY